MQRKNAIQYNVHAEIITAIPQLNYSQKIHYVPNESQKSILSFIIKDEGLSWISQLKAYLIKTQLPIKFDVVLITGGPFMHFSIAKFIKKRFKNTQVILDYRDPFAHNPVFSNNPLKIKLV